MDLGTFFVNEVILHKIPKVARSQKGTAAPELADAPSALDDRRRNFFRERIVTSLKAKSLPIVYDPEAGSPVPGDVLSFFKLNGANLVDVSQRMAEHLYVVQGGNSPEGALAVVDATMGAGKNAGRCLGVLKLEMDAAMLLHPTTTSDGKLTYDVRLEQVTLSQAAKVFKASLFTRATSLAGLAGMASDTQSDPSIFGDDVAEFFLSKFLGCKRRDPADRATLEFKERTEAAISKFVEDDGLKWQLERALLTELASTTKEIDPKAWVEKNLLDPDIQDAFLEQYKAEDGSVPVIRKETTLVAEAMRRRVIVFENGMRLDGSAQAVESSVVVKDGEVTISAGVKEVKSKR